MLSQVSATDSHREASIRSRFADLRSVAALILFCATTRELGELPPPVLAAFVAHLAERGEMAEERHTRSDHRTGRRKRVYIGAPSKSAIMAAIVPLAIGVVESCGGAEPTQHVRELAGRLVDRATDRWSVMRQFGFSARLNTTFSSAFGSRRKFDRAAGIRSVTVQRIGSGFYGFEPRHVSQLLAKDEFERSFIGFFPDIRPNFARRFCAMGLVRLCGPYTWGEAAEYLMLPVDSGTGMARRLIGVLKKGRTYEAFAAELHRVAVEMDTRPDPEDYGSIRQKLSTFSDIPNEDWRRICSSARVRTGKPGARSRYAAAWLWAEFTRGDWTLAPGLVDGNVGSQREVFRQLSKVILPRLAPELVSYGNFILQVSDT